MDKDVIIFKILRSKFSIVLLQSQKVKRLVSFQKRRYTLFLKTRIIFNGLSKVHLFYENHPRYEWNKK